MAEHKRIAAVDVVEFMPEVEIDGLGALVMSGPSYARREL